MGKLLNFFDNYILKIGIAFLIAFVPLYPKLPSIHIIHTWVYIRFEDFFIAAIVIVWLILLIRRKVKIPIKLGIPIAIYWVAGLASFIFSLIFIAPLLVNFFPTVAVLSYLRRIEYMILFFVAFSTIRNVKDLRDYLIILFLALTGVIFYGFGQRLYIVFWQLVAPLHLTRFFFCFPSFQTGNEEFAKGIPLCLSADGRVTSTFAGSYDLSAYLVVIIPILIALLFYVKKRKEKIGLFMLTVLSAIILNLTASRVSFVAYIVSGIAILAVLKRKIFIPAFLVISIIILVLFSQSTAKRIMQTLGFASVVVDSQGHIVGEVVPSNLEAKLQDNKLIVANNPNSNLPRGSSFIGLPQLKNKKTNVAVVSSGLSNAEAKKLKLENGGVQLTTVSGNFLVQKVLVYDISITTRLQAEWPNAINAFSQNYLLGSGFSTITLATDNDYLRLLGETGLIGFISFFSIFLIFGITAKNIFPQVKSRLARYFVIGLSCGILGLLINATLIDVFESSKVAESLWIMLGIGMGTLFLYKKEEVNYRRYFLRILKSNYFLLPISLVSFFALFSQSISNFFAADDFTWLRWAASSTVSDLPKYFTQANGFFYRPLDKTVVLFLYGLFSFNPSGYHIFILILHFIVGVGVYLLAQKILKNRLLSFISAGIFLFLPSQAENVFWLATISITMSSLFIVFGLLAFIRFRTKNNILFYMLSLLLGVCALFSYEMAVVYILLIALVDIFISKQKLSYKSIATYAPFVVLDIFYIVIRNAAHAFQPAGDYSYSLVHLIPNFVGNFVGYFGFFVFGERFLPIYNQARELLRTQTLFVLIIAVSLVIILSVVIIYNRSKLRSFYKNEKIKLLIFSLLFIFFALLPFLGLGNISPRYGYLASIGYALLLVSVLNYMARFVVKKLGKSDRWYYYVLIVLSVLIGIFYCISLRMEESEWQMAGHITNRTLSYLKLYDENIAPGSTLYFVNVPIRRDNAWVFPVGLTDGIWFLYRDDTMKIKQVASVNEAENLSGVNPKNTYIFYFDKNFNVTQVK